MFDNYRLEQNMKRLQAGELESFDEIYEQTNRLVYYVIYQIVKDHDLTQDLLQNTYMQIIKKIKDYKPTNAPKAWIVQIARNLSLNEIKLRNREVLVFQEDLDIQEKKEETPLIDLAQANLPEDEFLILMLCIGEGLTRREVAKNLGLSTSGVTWKLQQAMKKMQNLLKEK